MEINPENNEITLEEVDVNTDDLEKFDDLLHGRATPKMEVEEDVEDQSTNENGDDSTETELEDQVEEVETEDTETNDDGQEVDVVPEKPKKAKKTAQERINEITAARRIAERQLEVEIEKRKQLEEAISKQKEEKAKEVPKTDEAAAPDPLTKNEDGTDKYPLGEFDPNFIRDLTRHTIAKETEVQKALAAEEQTQRQEAELKTQAEKIAVEQQVVWESNVSSAEETHEDFRESVANLEETFSSVPEQVSKPLAEAIMASEHGTDVLYHLSKNIETAQEIIEMPQTKAILALGRIEAQFASKTPPAKPTNKVTKAKAPPTRTTRGTGSKAAVAADTDDLDAFEAQFFR